MLVSADARKSNTAKRHEPQVLVCGFHPMILIVSLLILCLGVTVGIAFVVNDSVRERHFRTFSERAQLRVSSIAQAFYGHIDELVSMRSALEGDASSTESLGTRNHVAEAVGDLIRFSNVDRVTAVAFMKEIDRVHIPVLEAELDVLYPDLVQRTTPFTLQAFAARGF